MRGMVWVEEVCGGGGGRGERERERKVVFPFSPKTTADLRSKKKGSFALSPCGSLRSLLLCSRERDLETAESSRQSEKGRKQGRRAGDAFLSVRWRESEKRESLAKKKWKTQHNRKRRRRKRKTFSQPCASSSSSWPRACSSPRQVSRERLLRGAGYNVASLFRSSSFRE